MSKNHDQKPTAPAAPPKPTAPPASFVTINRTTAVAIEKGLGSAAIKAADIRFSDYGPDHKKTVIDNTSIGAVVYVVPNDKTTPDADGTITRLFYNCDSTQDVVKMMVGPSTTGEAIVEAVAWAETVTGVTKVRLQAVADTMPLGFVNINKFTAQLIEKGLASAIKAADLRFTDYGDDHKKGAASSVAAADNAIIGPVAYVVPDDKTDPEGSGTLIELYYNCVGTQDMALMRVQMSVPTAIAAANTWAETTTGITKFALQACCPA